MIVANMIEIVIGARLPSGLRASLFTGSAQPSGIYGPANEACQRWRVILGSMILPSGDAAPPNPVAGRSHVCHAMISQAHQITKGLHRIGAAEGSGSESVDLVCNRPGFHNSSRGRQNISAAGRQGRMVSTFNQGSVRTLIEALIATSDPRLWARYCRLAAELAGGTSAPSPLFAVGSVEWQQQQDQLPVLQETALAAAEQAAGRRRLAQRGAAPPFTGAPSPFGAAGKAAFDEFVAHHRGPPALLTEIAAVEQELVCAFEIAGRTGRFRAAGFCDGARVEVEPEWFGQMQFDFAGNQLMLSGGSAIAGVEATLATAAAASAGRGARERPAKVMLRDALTALWARGAFTAGTGNERVLALVLQELHLSASDPPYGFKSAETIRKLRKALNMSL
jgi:hypothetical protein